MRLHPRDRRLIVGAPGQRLDGPRPGGRWIRQPLGHQPGADLVETIEQSEPQERRRVVQRPPPRSEEHTSELQSLMRISYAVFCLKKKKQIKRNCNTTID